MLKTIVSVFYEDKKITKKIKNKQKKGTSNHSVSDNDLGDNELLSNSKHYEHGIFMFRRDLRLSDNSALYRGLSQCKTLSLLFCFSPEQVKSTHYRSPRAVQFMIESISDINTELEAIFKTPSIQVIVFNDNPENILRKLLPKTRSKSGSGVNEYAVFFNEDYSPYAMKRDNNIIKLCQQRNVDVIHTHDTCLLPPGTIRTKNNTGTIYNVYTPFMKACRKYLTTKDGQQIGLEERKSLQSLRTKKGKRTIQDGFHWCMERIKSVGLKSKLTTLSDQYRIQNVPSNTMSNTISNTLMEQYDRITDDVVMIGGRTNGLKRLTYALRHVIPHYKSERDTLSKQTSRLSAFIKFGCLSSREIWREVMSNSKLSSSIHGKSFTDQLLWRDFYIHLLWDNPKMIDMGQNGDGKSTSMKGSGEFRVAKNKAMRPEYDKIKWRMNKNYVKAWREGTTGFPIVDAGMRQLAQVGFMHNRARMIVGSFLVKTLLQDWRIGEKHFAEQLIDYDPANNNGGWQWVAGSGADSQPYFRIFNPWSQSSRFDPNAEYIKKWIPELKDIPAKHLHEWNTYCEEYKEDILDTHKYVKPIVDYSQKRKEALDMYKSGLRS